MPLIFHIADAAEWNAAVPRGEYTQSTRDQTLAEVGFIHCSYDKQVAGVAQAHYAEVKTPLVLLTIDPALLTSELKVEPPAEGADPYPHIYGPLNVDAVLGAAPFHA